MAQEKITVIQKAASKNMAAADIADLVELPVEDVKKMIETCRANISNK